MGLKERRAIKEFQDNVYPALKNKVDLAAGFNVEIEIDWDSLAEENMMHCYNEHWTKVYFEPVLQGFAEICVDEMGKEALKDCLKKIVFCNIEGNSSAKKAISFKDGILKIDHKSHTNVDYSEERKTALVDLLSDNL